MTHSPPGTGNDTAAGSGREPASGMPRWVKAYGTVLVVSFVAYVVLKFTVFAGM